MAAAHPGTNVVIHWFRKALRLHDNCALLRAKEIAFASSEVRSSTSSSSVTQQAGGKLVMVFVLDPVFLTPPKPGQAAGTGIGRCSSIPLRFLCEALDDLDSGIKRINPNQQLLLLEGDPLYAIPDLCRKVGATHLTFEPEEVEPYGKRRDQIIKERLGKAGVRVETSGSHTLFPMAKYPSHRPATYQSFISAFGNLGEVPSPLPPPEQLPEMPMESITQMRRTAYEIVGMEEKPTIPPSFPGGETNGLLRLQEKVTKNPKWVKSFAKPDTSPCQFAPAPSTTTLSPYLTFGCLSVRKFWQELSIAERLPGPTSKPPESLKGQLLWREHFYLQSYLVGPNFDRMEGSPICRQIPWKTWKRGEEERSEHFQTFLAWKEGRTGHPFIDACMRQLVQTGWMHHLARHAVACFVTRGDLFIHWEHARDVFSEYLVDGDWALNNANWLWLSCSAFFHQYFRVYGPESFPKKYDPNGAFVRKYCPELSKFPKQFIYAPWKAPLEVQRQCGCIIGKDYPKPIVPDHAATSKVNIQIMQAAFDASHAPQGGSKVKPRTDEEDEVDDELNPPATQEPSGKRAKHMSLAKLFKS